MKSLNQILAVRGPGVSVAFVALILFTLLHAYCLIVFGATWWVDSINYIELGESLRSSREMSLFYTFPFNFSYLGPGTPLEWLGLRYLPLLFRWPVLAVVQHALAVLAVLHAWETARYFGAPRTSLVVLLLFSLCPFYQAFHNSLMTESVVSSFFLIGVSLSARMLTGGMTRKHFGLLLVMMFLAAQFRVYVVILFVCMIVLILLSSRRLFTWSTVAAVCAIVLSIYVYPVYRSLVVKKWVPLYGEMQRFVWGLEANPSPSTAVITALKAQGQSYGLDVDRICSAGLTDGGWHPILKKMRGSGLNDREIESQWSELAGIVRRDEYVGCRSAVLGACSSGLLLSCRLGPKDFRLTRQVTMQKMYWHLLGHYRWLSWVGDKYEQRLDITAKQFAGARGTELLVASWRPYVRDMPEWMRDPLGMVKVTPDIWVLAGLIGAALVFLVNRSLGLLLVSLAIINSVMLARTPLGDIRYAYILFPVYFFAMACGSGVLISRLRRSIGPDAGKSVTGAC